MSGAKFIITEELGKLAKWLRILGYDSVYHDKKDTAGLVIQALRDERILITRSPALTKYKGIKAVVVKSDHAEEQVEQVIRELKLTVDEGLLFQRCVECNTPLESIMKEKVKGKVPEYVFETQGSFKRCPQCEKIFWKGTHWDMVKKWMEKARIAGK
jgi:uncharacterized protein with PIN domain